MAAESGSDRTWPDLPAAGPAHRRTRSSNTQMPSLDEHAVLQEPGLPALTPPPAAAAAAAGAQVLTLGAGVAADGVGLQRVGSGGWNGILSRRSSRADSEASSGGDSTAGGLVCEPSSFGVCADPAGENDAITAPGTLGNNAGCFVLPCFELGQAWNRS